MDGGSTPVRVGRRPARRSPLAAATLLALGAGILLALTLVALIADDGELGSPGLPLTLVAVGVVHMAAGALAGLRRPGSRLGPLLFATGLAWQASAAGFVAIEPLRTVGAALALLPSSISAHAVLAFPSGRLGTRESRAIALAAYVVCVPLNVLALALAPDGPLSISDRPELASAVVWGQRALGIVAVLAACRLLERRFRTAPRRQRRLLGPLWLYGIVALVGVPLGGFVARLLSDRPGASPELLAAQAIVLAGVPVVFTLAVTRGAFARTAELEELSAWLADGSGRGELRSALARTLGDPSVELLFRVPEGAGWVRADGIAAGAPMADATRGVEAVTLDGDVVGAIVYDAGLVAGPGEVRRAARVAALALERERLWVALRASRARLVSVADAERRRLARDLHDGLQARLVLLGLRAGLIGGSAAALRDELGEIIDELRALVSGMQPAALTERGLPAAVEGLADQAPIPVALEVDNLGQRLSPEVESTGYMVVAEALANAFKHADPTDVGIALRRAHDGPLRIEVRDDGCGGATTGHGTRSIVDRVEALGGRVEIVSDPGAGTLIRAEIPCGS